MDIKMVHLILLVILFIFGVVSETQFFIQKQKAMVRKEQREREIQFLNSLPPEKIQKIPLNRFIRLDGFSIEKLQPEFFNGMNRNQFEAVRGKLSPSQKEKLDLIHKGWL